MGDSNADIEKAPMDEKLSVEDTFRALSMDTKVQDGSEEAAGQKPTSGNASAILSEAGSNATSSPEHKWLTGAQLLAVTVAMLLSVLLIAIDQSIVATALPHIVSQFDALSSVSWVASAYFLTQAGFILFFGGALSIAPTKYVFMIAVTLFELGSLICGVAPNMNVLIFGRAFAGVGAAGIFGACIAMIAEICPIEQRPAIMGSFGGVFALASVMGPLLGGVFTDHVSWRWCFYINLPIGAVSVAAIAMFLSGEYSPLNHPRNFPGTTKLQRWLQLDWIGTAICVGLVTALLLPLQWGGNTKPWSDKSVIALFCVFAVVLVIFLAWEWKMGNKALVPFYIFKNRTQIGCCVASFFLMLCFLSGIYYLPLYYQAKGHSATRSGIDILPFMMLTVAGTMISGGIITKTGRYLPWLVAGPLIASVGGGLLYTMSADMPSSRLIGYQVLFGFGLGIAFQNTFIAIQAEYNHDEAMIPKTSSTVTFTQLVGGVIGIAIAGTIFANSLSTQLHHFAPNLDSTVYDNVRASVTYIHTLPLDQQVPVIKAYSRAVGYVFLLTIPAGILSSLSALLIRNHDIRNMNIGAGGGA